MQKNDLVTVRIEDMGTGGEGIGKVDGCALFIKDAIIGDLVEAKVMKMKKNYGYARLMNILAPSPARQNARCKEARRCGGCQIQEMDYRQQLDFKKDKVENNLLRLGAVPKEVLDAAMEGIIGMDEPSATAIKPSIPLAETGRTSDSRILRRPDPPDHPPAGHGLRSGDRGKSAYPAGNPGIYGGMPCAALR